MANMSYCRWENTSGDMADCVRAQEAGFDPEKANDYERDGYYEALRQAAALLENAEVGHLDRAEVDLSRLEGKMC